jgi:hypothetical protein
MTIRTPREKFLSRTNWILALAATTAAILLHAIFLTHAGGLWRDEAGVVRLATLPTFAETWKYLGHESCPLVFPTAIRAWSAIGLGGTDFDLRIYGFIVGLLILGAVWFNGWALTRSVPLISLGLLAVNVAVVRWGDSLRAYGTGSVLMLLTVALMWRFVASPNRNRWLLAALAAFFSVQCLFQNAFLLLAVCIAGGAVCLRRKDIKNLVAVLAIGFFAAISMIPYFRIIRESEDWSVVSQTGFMPGVVWQNLSEALAGAAPWLKWLWIGPAIGVVFQWAKIIGRREPVNENSNASVVLYAATALIAGALSFFVYLRLAALPTEVWYYLPLITFLSVCIDAALAGVLPRFPIWRLLFLGTIVTVAFPKTFELAQYRQTDMDLVAEALRQRATPNDLIILNPWYYGISFERYFNGKTPWLTVPDLDDHRFHRYDLFKIKMQTQNPIQPVLDKIAATLQSGHRVWLVGAFNFGVTPGQPPGPAPNKSFGWSEEPYLQTWRDNVSYFLTTHIRHAARITIQSANSINALENVPLIVVGGWREPQSVLDSR